jgi:thiamine biosynthesis lipoprotein ApbE
MSTTCRVNFRAATAALAQACQSEALDWTGAFEARYSRFIPESIIGQINTAAGRDWVEVEEETDRMFSFCGEMVFFTRGVFDPAALPLIRLWNWKGDPPELRDGVTIATADCLAGAQPLMNGCRSVTVIAASGTLAGILSTSAFVLGPRQGLDLVRLCHGAEACITTENSRYQTQNFNAYLVN